MPNKSTKLEVIGYYTDLNNFYIDGSDSYSNKEIDENGEPDSDFMDVILYGGSIGLSHKIGNFILEAMYSYTDGEQQNLYFDLVENDDDTAYSHYETQWKDLLNVAKHKASASVKYKLNNKLTMNLSANYMGKRKVDPNNLTDGEGNSYTYWNPDGEAITTSGNGYMASYLLFNFYIKTNLGGFVKSLKGFTVSAGIKNILNAQYADAPVSAVQMHIPRVHPQPGRTISLSLSYRY